MKVNPKYRLDLFRLIVKLDAEYRGMSGYEEARALLDRLVKLRARGLEPPHQNGKYLPRSLDDLV